MAFKKYVKLIIYLPNVADIFKWHYTHFFNICEELDEYIKVLDNRLEKNQIKPVGFVAKKCRRVGSPSVSMPPPYSPAWAIKASKDGMSIYIHCDTKA